MGNLIQSDLDHFSGTQNYYRHRIGNKEMFLTDGTKHVAEEGKAYWLFDIILSYQGSENLCEEFLQFWKLEKRQAGGWLVTCDDGLGNVLVKQEIPYSDFPLETIKLYFSNYIVLLPSEY